jgi:hypothetical protein
VIAQFHSQTLVGDSQIVCYMHFQT